MTLHSHQGQSRWGGHESASASSGGLKAKLVQLSADKINLYWCEVPVYFTVTQTWITQTQNHQKYLLQTRCFNSKGSKIALVRESCWVLYGSVLTIFCHQVQPYDTPSQFLYKPLFICLGESWSHSLRGVNVSILPRCDVEGNSAKWQAWASQSEAYYFIRSYLSLTNLP